MGVSGDPPVKQKKFADKYGFLYPLLCDQGHEVMKAYGVWGPKKLMGREYEGIRRTTYLIDEQGKVAKVYAKVRPPNHAKAILEEWA